MIKKSLIYSHQWRKQMPKGIPNKKTPASNEPQISKMDAMRQAIKELGYDAKTVKYQRLLKSRFGLVIDTNTVSNYKSSIKREQAKKSALIPTPAAIPAASVLGFSLDEIEAVKELADKIGAEKVKQLVEVLGK
jgi:adenylate kinase family enzyme